SQSGYMPTYRALHFDTLGLPSAEEGGKALAVAAGAADAASLRAADLTALSKAGLATGWQPEPVIDGVVLKRQLAEPVFRREHADRARTRAGSVPCERAAVHFRPRRAVCNAGSELAASPTHRRGDAAL